MNKIGFISETAKNRSRLYIHRTLFDKECFKPLLQTLNDISMWGGPNYENDKLDMTGWEFHVDDITTVIRILVRYGLHTHQEGGYQNQILVYS